MVRPDSQIKASRGPAASMLGCWMIRAFHRLGKTLRGTWQADLFPVRYAEQTEQERGPPPPPVPGESERRPIPYAFANFKLQSTQ